LSREECCLAQFCCCRKQHIARAHPSRAAKFDIKRAVGLGAVIRAAVPQQRSRTVDGRFGAFEFEERSDRCFVQLHLYTGNSGQDIGRSKLFVLKYWPQAQSTQDSLHLTGCFSAVSSHIAEFDFDLFLDLEASLGCFPRGWPVLPVGPDLCR